MNRMNFINQINRNRKPRKKRNTGAVHISQVNLIKAALLVLLLTAAFLIGRGIAYVRYEKINDWIVPVSGSASSENWGLG